MSGAVAFFAELLKSFASAIATVVTKVTTTAINAVYKILINSIKPFISLNTRVISNSVTSTGRASGTALTGARAGTLFYKHKVEAALFAVNKSWLLFPLAFALCFFLIGLVLFGAQGIGYGVSKIFEWIRTGMNYAERQILSLIDFKSKPSKRNTNIVVKILLYILVLFLLLILLVVATIVMAFEVVVRLFQGIYVNIIPLSVIVVFLVLFTLGGFVLVHTVNTTSLAVEVGEYALNVAFGLINVLADVWDMVEPMIDTYIYAAVQFFILIYETVSGERHVPDCSLNREAPESDIDFRRRRILELAQVIDITEFEENFGKVINFIAYIQVLLNDFDILMMGILISLSESEVFQVLLGALLVVIGQILCFLFGTFSRGFSTCGLQEFANILFSGFLPIKIGAITLIPNVPICSGIELLRLGVPCRCGGRATIQTSRQGGIVNFGFYENLGKGDTCGASVSNRRVLTCEQDDLNSWVEYMDNLPIHHADNRNDSCIHIRKSLDPIYSAEVFNTLKIEGDCFDSCVMGVGYTVCNTVTGQHSVEITGSCGNKKYHAGFKEGFSHAKRVLRDYTTNPNIRELSTRTREEEVKRMQKEVPTRFTTEYGLQCDLSRTSWSNIYEIAVDLICLGVYQYRQKHLYEPAHTEVGGKPGIGRKLLPDSFETIDKFHRRLRLFNTVDANKTIAERMVRFTRRENTDFALHSPYPLMVHRFKEIVSRRSLTQVYTECGELYQCCDKSCVPFELRDTCPNTEGDLACTINQFLINIDITLKNFNTATYLASIRSCWDGYTCNPMTFPMNPVNLLSGNTIGVVYCVPFIGKVGGRLEKIKINAIKDIFGYICGPSDDVNNACSCSEYLDVYVDSYWWAYITTGVPNRLHNAVTVLYTFCRMIVADPTVTTADIVCASRNVDDVLFCLLLGLFIIIILFAATPFYIYVIKYFLRPGFKLIWPNANFELSFVKRLENKVEAYDYFIRNRLYKDINSLVEKNLAKLEANLDVIKARLDEMEKAEEARKEAKALKRLKKGGKVGPEETEQKGLLFKSYLDQV